MNDPRFIGPTPDPEFEAAVERMKKLLARARAQTDKKTDVVPADRFDQAMWSDLLGEAKTLRDLIDQIDVDIDYSTDLVRDVVLALWREDTTTREAREMRITHLLNHLGVTFTMATELFDEAHRLTQHDEYLAAMSGLTVAELAAEVIRQARQGGGGGGGGGQEGDEEGDQKAPGCMPGADWATQDTDDINEMADDLEAELDGADREARDEQAKTRIESGDKMRSAVERGLDKADRDNREEQEVMRDWGLDPGEVRNMPFEDRHQLAKLLRTGKLREYASLVGRFRRFASAQRARKTEGREHPVELTLGGDPSRIVASELVAFRHRKLRRDFLRRMTEHQLLSRKYEGEERVGKGPIICLVDSSGSMSAAEGSHTREAWAKGLALALLAESGYLRRDFHGINFSAPSQQDEFSAPRGHAKSLTMMEWASKFYGGGTSFDEPLTMALDHIRRSYSVEGRAKADIVLITDGQGRLEQDTIERIERAKKDMGVRVWCIYIGREPTYQLEQIGDDVRAIHDLGDLDQVADIFQSMTRYSD